MKRKSTWVIISLAILTALSVSSLFYRAFITQDFEQTYSGDETLNS
ncbi:MAG: hypothetical protein RL097_518 [Candidatus Parcubacteria bacterium]|jgi:hypothetical protein